MAMTVIIRLSYFPQQELFIYQYQFEMLSFTHSQNKFRKHPSIDEQDFQPIVIGPKSVGRQKSIVHPEIPSKKIIKAHTNFNIGSNNNNRGKSNKIIENKKMDTHFRKDNEVKQKQWNTYLQPNKKGIFDKGIKRDTLAAQERRQRAQSNKNKKQKHNYEADVYHQQIEIQKKKVEVYKQQKDKQIQKLKAMIQQERKLKLKNDQIYETKKQQIQKERLELQEIQKRIQKQGPKFKKQHREKLRELEPQLYPGNDRGKCHQQIMNLPKQTSFPEITQSQSIANQRIQLREKQLHYLVDQREKNHLNYQRNTLGYTPTLIPLLSKASYKIISTHVSSLVELFIDDLLEEQVLILQTIELQQIKQKQSHKEKQILHDYIDNLATFVDEVDEISCKVGRYSDLKFEELYRLPRKQISEHKSGFSYSSLTPLFYKLNLTLDNKALEQLEEKVKRFQRFVQNFGEYKPEQLRAMSSVTEDIIDEAITKIAKQIDGGAGEFVNIVFRGQFQ